MPTPINQLFNDESIAVQIVLLELAMDLIEHRFNW